MLRAVTTALSRRTASDGRSRHGRREILCLPGPCRPVRDSKQHARDRVDQHHQPAGSTDPKGYPGVEGSASDWISAQPCSKAGRITCVRAEWKSSATMDHGMSKKCGCLPKVLVWLDGGASGDRNDINLTRPAEKDVWTKLSAEDDACTTETCLGREGGACPILSCQTSCPHLAYSRRESCPSAGRRCYGEQGAARI